MKNDIVAVLSTDHALLARLANELRNSQPAVVARLSFRQFAAALGGHLTAVKKVIYPGLKSVGWKDVRSDLLVNHARLTHAFAELLTLQTESDAFAQALRDLLATTERLIEQEKNELLPLLSAHLDASQRMSIGIEAGAYLVHDADPHQATQRVSASEWLEEARLLLGGAPAPSRSLRSASS